jgi:hypothetical protein
MSNQPSVSLSNYNVRQIDAERLVASLSSNPTLVSLVTSAGLLDTLKENAGTITVLVPPEQTLKSLPSTVTNNKQALREILLYHVISNSASLANIIDNNNINALYPPTIKIDTLLIPPNLRDDVNSQIEMAQSENNSGMGSTSELSSLTGMLPGATIGNSLGPMPKSSGVPDWLRKSGPGNNWA